MKREQQVDSHSINSSFLNLSMKKLKYIFLNMTTVNWSTILNLMRPYKRLFAGQLLIIRKITYSCGEDSRADVSRSMGPSIPGSHITRQLTYFHFQFNFVKKPDYKWKKKQSGWSALPQICNARVRIDYVSQQIYAKLFYKTDQFLPLRPKMLFTNKADSDKFSKFANTGKGPLFYQIFQHQGRGGMEPRKRSR